MLSLHPIFAAWLGFWLLGEAMTWVGVCGMALTLAGVAWVVLERAQEGELRGSLWLGILGGVGGAVGQAVGAVLAKAGLGHAPGSLLEQWMELAATQRVEVHAFFGTLIRMGRGSGAADVVLPRRAAPCRQLWPRCATRVPWAPHSAGRSLGRFWAFR